MPNPLQRILAHKVVLGGHVYTMAIVELSDDCRSVSVRPFKHETEATTMHNGIIEVLRSPDGAYSLRFSTI